MTNSINKYWNCTIGSTVLPESKTGNNFKACIKIYDWIFQKSLNYVHISQIITAIEKLSLLTTISFVKQTEKGTNYIQPLKDVQQQRKEYSYKNLTKCNRSVLLPVEKQSTTTCLHSYYCFFLVI